MASHSRYTDWSEVPEVLRPPEVAKLFGTSLPTVYRHMREGSVPCHETPFGYRFVKGELMASLGVTESQPEPHIDHEALRAWLGRMELDIAELRRLLDVR